MKEVFRLVGETAAQSIWNLSAGDQLTPLLSTVDEDGQANYMRLAMDNSDDAIRYGQDKLERHEEGKVGAVFVADGYISLDSGVTDALVVDVRVYQKSVIKCQMVIPYRSANSAKGFAIHRPQVTALENIDEVKLQPMFDEFFSGVEAHDQGAKIWNEYYRDDTELDAYDYPVSFDASVWHLMQETPFLAFYLVAAPDGSAAQADIDAFATLLASGVKYQSTVMNQLLPYGIENYQDIIARLDSGDVAYLEQLQRAVDEISKHFHKLDAKSFKLALVAMVQELLQAKMRKNGTASLCNDSGKMALARLILALDIELDS